MRDLYLERETDTTSYDLSLSPKQMKKSQSAACRMSSCSTPWFMVLEWASGSIRQRSAPSVVSVMLELWWSLHGMVLNVTASTPDHTLHQKTDLHPEARQWDESHTRLHFDLRQSASGATRRCWQLAVCTQMSFTAWKIDKEMGTGGTTQSFRETVFQPWLRTFEKALAQEKTHCESSVISAIAQDQACREPQAEAFHCEMEVSPERWKEIPLKGFPPNAYCPPEVSCSIVYVG